MRIVEAFGRDHPVISFEFFPPKTEKGFDALYRTVAELKRLDPSFVSVTWGAGGSTRSQTIDLVTRIEHEIGITAMAHLTCVGATADELGQVLERLAREGIENVLALGGDPPRDQPDYRPPPGGFSYADELVRFVRSRFDFCIGAACYPETHPRAASPAADLANLVRKVESGVDFLVTQLFFDNEDYFRFVARAREAGIRVPIVPGIMPVVSHQNVLRMTALCGAKIPRELDHLLARAGDDAARTLEVGIAWATEQCRELLARGAPGLHFYTLNQSPATRRIHANLFGES
ncbi:MAG TPA: methylenetetrahydrofolate reductase [NAD(P)H] [Myxococcota bacterium]|jgi:methylenetetrahydrofolate reductase (NADPH)|nr:methylenetetrahydrofolate reductase [NAD(P)H] [Myxococcota bacterium]